MSEILSKNEQNAHMQFSKQVLNQLCNIRQKFKRQNLCSIYDMVHSIYMYLRDPIMSKITCFQAISSKEYLGNSRDSIQQMLVFIKGKICDDTQVQNKKNRQNNQHYGGSFYVRNQAKISPFQELLEPQIQIPSMLKQKQAEIERLSEQIRLLENTNKSIQIKLLNNVKRLTLQIQQKDIELNQVRKILQEKEQEIEDMCILNEKKHKKMRKLEEDIYDLRLELVEKNYELEAERDCADFLEKKVDKMMSFSSESHLLSKIQEMKAAQSITQASEELSGSQL